MTTLADLHQTVRATLASGRLGTPVFVRYHAHVPWKNALVGQLTWMAGEAGVWLGQGVTAARAVGSVRDGSVSLILEFAAGATALVSAATGTDDRAGATLAVLGNRGALYHDVDSRVVGGPSPAAPEQANEPGFVALIQKALRDARRTRP